MEKKWISTEQMLEMLKQEPDREQQYCHNLGLFFRTTHWVVYSSSKKMIKDSLEISQYVWFTEEEFLKHYEGHSWIRED